MAFVTVEQVNNALRLGLELDTDPSAPVEDTSRFDDIVLKIDQAQGIVLDYLKMTPERLYELGWTNSTDTPGNVTAAIILVIRCLLDDTEDSTTLLSGLSGVGMPVADVRNPIVALLYRLRDPAIA